MKEKNYKRKNNFDKKKDIGKKNIILNKQKGETKIPILLFYFYT